MNTTFLRSACQFCIKNLGQRQKGTSSHKWMQRQHKDPYVKRAREENWRCRSAFKLLEIDDKHKLFTPGQLVIDIGAAPGSWTQVACRRINASGSGKSKGNRICCFIINDLYWRPSYIAPRLRIPMQSFHPTFIMLLTWMHVQMFMSDPFQSYNSNPIVSYFLHAKKCFTVVTGWKRYSIIKW